jgi:enterochelin esterase-like enzyme
MVSRRAFLLGTLGIAGLAGAGAGAVALAAGGVIPGKAVVDQQLGFCDVDVPRVTATAGPIVAGTFPSKLRRTTVAYKIAYPPGHRPGSSLPVSLVLHGYASDESGALAAGNYPANLAATVAAGTPPFALASVAGGNGYWHPHPDDDPLGMLTNEFLPVLRSHDLSVGQPAVLGYSMGGYGALMCGLTQPTRYSTIVANAPAFWRSYDEAHRVNAGSFSSAAEWESYGDVLGRADDVGHLSAHIYVGESDSFEPVVKALADRLPDASVVRISKGCHDGTFWQAHAPEQLRIIGTALSA